MEHAINWFEIPVADLARAMRFYAAMTGWPLRREAFGGPQEEMAVFEVAGRGAVNGALLAGPDARPSDRGTVVYLNAGQDLDGWLARAAAAGARVVTPRTALPEGMGFFAHLIDTEGNRIGLHGHA